MAVGGGKLDEAYSLGVNILLKEQEICLDKYLYVKRGRRDTGLQRVLNAGIRG